MTGQPIWIAIPTFKRPSELRHLLETLAKLVQRQDVMVLVADNDGGAAEGVAVAAALQRDGYPLPFSVLRVAEPGLCSVRNAICDVAMADPAMRFIAMIDDDEWPQPGWLDALLACQAQVGADVVAGPVDFHFTGKPPRWAGQTLVFRPEQRAWGATGTASSKARLNRETRHFSMVRLLMIIHARDDAHRFCRQIMAKAG